MTLGIKMCGFLCKCGYKESGAHPSVQTRFHSLIMKSGKISQTITKQGKHDVLFIDHTKTQVCNKIQKTEISSQRKKHGTEPGGNMWPQ